MPNGAPVSDVSKRLLEKASRYSFYQLVQLIVRLSDGGANAKRSLVARQLLFTTFFQFESDAILWAVAQRFSDLVEG